MERRIAKMNISFAGGTASSGSKTCKVTLPTSWVEAMEIDESHRELELVFDGTSITLSRRLSGPEFAARQLATGHEVRVLRLYDGDTLCSTRTSPGRHWLWKTSPFPWLKPPLETTHFLLGKTSSSSLKNAVSPGSGPDCGSI